MDEEELDAPNQLTKEPQAGRKSIIPVGSQSQLDVPNNLPGEPEIGRRSINPDEPTLDEVRKVSFPSGVRLRARSNPPRRLTPELPAATQDVPTASENQPLYEVRTARAGRQRKSLKAVRSQSLDTVLQGNKSKSSEEISSHVLFKEALYTSTHFLGRPTGRLPSNREDLAVYSLITFASDSKEQVAVQEHVMEEAYPLIIVNTLVKRAEHLTKRTNQSFCDTYCFVGIETMDSLDQKEWKTVNIGSPQRPKPTKLPSNDHVRPIAEKRLTQTYSQLQRHVRTTIGVQTANPVWEQRFQCLTIRPSMDKLSVEVWDHLDENAVVRAIKQANSAKKPKSNPQEKKTEVSARPDAFLGKVVIRVDDIPAEGLEKWHNLTGKTHRGEDAVGRILLQIWLSHAFRHGKHFEEYAEPKVMLENLWDYILDLEAKKNGQGWNGEIPIAGTCLLFQYGLQTGMSEASQAIIRWNAYAKYDLGIHGVGSRLSELDAVLSKVYQEESDHRRNAELETSMIVMCIQKLCPVIRNHFAESQESVREALKSLKQCRNILSKYKSDSAVLRVEWLQEACLRMSVLEWYALTYYEVVESQHMTEQHELVCGVALVINKVNVLLGEGQTKWKTLFWMEGSIDYLPIVYDELQKMVVHDVEPIAWSILRYFDNNQKLRRMLQKWSPTSKAYSNGWAVCQALFKLFVETQIFAMAQQDISDKILNSPYDELNEYHRWFRPVLVMWLGFTFVRACEMATKAIHMDDHIPQDAYVKTSSSATDIAVVIQQLVNFWKELNWPNAPESFVILHFIIDVICKIALLYTIIHQKKLTDEGYFDMEDRFDISDRLCTAFNNLQAVKEAAMNAPGLLKIEHLITDLTVHLGEVACKEYSKNIDITLKVTVRKIEQLFRDIMAGVASRVGPEIREALQRCLVMIEKQKSLDEALDSLFQYLTDNLDVLYKSLLEGNFSRFLVMFWGVTCLEIVSVAKEFPLFSTVEQINFFGQVQHILPLILTYFKGGLTESELDIPEYETAQRFLTFFTSDTPHLIGIYYGEKASILKKDQQQKKSKYGTLQVGVNYWAGKLNVHVLNSRGLRAMDSSGIFNKKPSSDPYVQIEVLPENNFNEPETQKTKTVRKTLNPDFDEKFAWNLTHAECQHPNSVIRFTVKDYDIATGDDFLGEAFIPLHNIPGIAEQGAISQPITLTLQVVNPNDPVLAVLKSRNWDPEANEFVEQQFKRQIEDVKKTK